MPELPEVEVVRRGLGSWVRGRIIEDVQVLDPRSIRRHSLGAQDFRGNLMGARVVDAVRRGKFLWMPLEPSGSTLPKLPFSGQNPAGKGHLGRVDATHAPGTPDTPGVQPSVALMAHLGMSGQLLVEGAGAADEKHLKVRFTLSPATDVELGELPRELRFVDQRIFGGLFVTGMVPTADGQPGGLGESPLPLIPVEAAHIARDPLDQAFSFDEFFRRLRARKTGIKRAILDQSLVSGVGNIYADEALWAAKLHFARAADKLRRADALRLIEACRSVMERALEAGGTSFDSLYVNVNGASGYFERSLNAYGRETQPCRRCAVSGLISPIRRDIFMNRSSYTCPHCQPIPRNARW
ncbi:bifunctional DNA-formamidopyrimidine glycosylase/DNA-(apurinic or apyrimidinic site) lyase [Arthrobacter sp. H5]|uniref:bifunctional DNA-formamidopyrimidine glycosylase/DNA-(apurinic or apyrimidinic site) lyase n=1 Tax=Arthrobacter sp. H5 TaxID=1267973 RepID=UPI0004819A82|nr:bifunctional DNA-formamidopyrimidine glycosylase/DNA-(apurinic or apyrimidinic site) lyase [Arthrobacter sp. H5]